LTLFAEPQLLIRLWNLVEVMGVLGAVTTVFDLAEKHLGKPSPSSSRVNWFAERLARASLD